MTVFLVLLGLLVVLAVAGTVREARLDRPREVPRSRFVPADFRPPATNGRGLDTRSWARGLDR
ncbi:hypothetical protein [Nocardioides bizhenqiangii]|uniref:Uncharacterized protein n=1 Tax=Nocardioides bizhenqiangii TaxID=3095076 RepID=A0ABZ0ZXF6_9ACTN|nr:MULTISPECIES: hypothetical protein [unclassified Nocardioides]MDZ5622985.1 hypothetical protein [Nocardioides sp. HM23]WQQ27968.1 hypothetical protein SHK19_06960 [Nocardioides sp. HM61]